MKKNREWYKNRRVMKNCKKWWKGCNWKENDGNGQKNDNSVEQELKRPLRILINKF
jgi:hypothetical protein